ncbi:McrB family protein [Alkalisalibacterium limincola]|uniref:AAA domain-containing protein n=1 Tax=Alkalisalibacterium limincola TaxID=2699169 RepID=A0A5C8KNK3_9GAMM|nr:AAA family ATPase [Alkalisalibacterium limincola]TXK61004.1 AAA domain-containing protein [Alkalisalibacterium limincola]
MTDTKSGISSSTTWFVGASYGQNDDQLSRFLSDGIWENGYEDRHLDLVRSMRPGDRIAIKSSYTRKHDLPFESRGHTASVMAIKAIGIITANVGDGRQVKVDWAEKLEPAREWYFYTHRGTVWRVQSGDWMTDGLIAFAFDGKPQDLLRFQNAPYWQERFGTAAPDRARFGWTNFYEAIADKLLDYRNDRAALLKGIQEISGRVEGLGHLGEDKYADGTSGFIRDICPFTTMGLFNRGIKDSNRKIIAAELAKFLGVQEPVPKTFEGIPLLNNLTSWYFPYELERTEDHMDVLWEVFSAGITFADTEDDDARYEFAEAFDSASGRPRVAWNLTFGLYWARPWAFLSLDQNSQAYVSKKLQIPIGRNGPKGRCTAADYLAVMDALEPRFQEVSYPVHSYPELSLEAWLYKEPSSESATLGEESEDDDNDALTSVVQEAVGASKSCKQYSVEDILSDGCFLERAELDRLLSRLRAKSNLILQGPPGTGKTWLAKRLAFALVGQKDESKVRAVQFHPNLSYEDFVRGWRPTGEGKLSLADGVFMDAIKAASKNPASKFVVVIEEINRGNPAQIFGELLTLLEAGKRTPSEALQLCYPDADGSRNPVHVPENLYLIGTMNIADRSLALVDLALRRRFAFVSLEPKLGSVWREWVINKRAVDPALVGDIEDRILELNNTIAADRRLGKQFEIGHSYVTPVHPMEPGETRAWFQQVVETEIGPLLEEYWFDAPDEAMKATERLTQGW